MKNTSLKSRLATLLKSACVAACLMLGAQAQAVSIAYDNSSVVTIPGLSGYATSGNEMAGMTVTAVFHDGLTQTLTWAATGGQSGGVTGTGWGLSLNGDSFDNAWNFTNSTQRRLLNLTLDGTGGLTLFDLTTRDCFLIIFCFDTEGTPGSSSGQSFDTNLLFDGHITATYRNPVMLEGSQGPVGDLYQVLDIDFGRLGHIGKLSFWQDTDNDERIDTPPVTEISEPAMLGLIFLGLMGLNLIGRRRRRSLASA